MIRCRIDLFAVNDTYNPPEPGFGLLVGTDSNGGDGWSVTFNPDARGADKWVGYLVAEAHFAGHDPEAAGDAAAIYITRDQNAPQGGVGGIAELPSLAGTSGEEAGAAAQGSGWSAGGYAALAGGLAAVVLVFGAGGWYLRRRSIR